MHNRGAEHGAERGDRVSVRSRLQSWRQHGRQSRMQSRVRCVCVSSVRAEVEGGTRGADLLILAGAGTTFLQTVDASVRGARRSPRLPVLQYNVPSRS